MVKYFKPYIDKKEIKAVEKVLKSGWLTTGSKVQQLEEMYKEITGRRYAVSLSSATSALFLTAKALFSKDKSYVVTTPLTFISTVEGILHAGFVPHYEDVYLSSFNINLSRFIPRPDCAGFLPVCMGGRPVYNKFFSEYPTLIDAAHMSPSKVRKMKGDALVFSLYANKNVTAGEGGIMVTDDVYLYDKVKSLSYHGKTDGGTDYDITELGYKMNLSDIHAAIAIEQIKKLEKTDSLREEIAECYTVNLEGLDGIHVHDYSPENSYHLFQILVDRRIMNGQEFRSKLLEKGVETSLHYRPVPSFSSKEYNKPNCKQLIPNSYIVYEQSASLPIYPSLQVGEVRKVVNSIKEIINVKNSYK